MFGFRLQASAGRRVGARDWTRILAIATISGVTAPLVAATAATAKTPGKTYCFYKKCHRVKTLAETQALVGKDLTLTASFYDSCKRDRYNPCGLTSSGERFNADRADNAASPDLPDGTIALVWSKATGQAVVLRINNAGPYWGNRKLDLSRAAARKLGVKGVGQVKLRVLKAPTRAEARYSKNRVYERVPGPIGQFASVDHAYGAIGVMVAQGKAGTTALASIPGLAPAVNVASVLDRPLVPRADLPRGALAAALAAQAEVERRILTATIDKPALTIQPSKEASIDAQPVAVPLDTPEVSVTQGAIRAEPVPPRTIRTAEIAEPKASRAGLTSAISANPARPAKLRVASAERKKYVKKRPLKAKTKARAKGTAKMASKSAPVRKKAVAKHSGEIDVGFTTYAEKRFQKKAKASSLSANVKKKTAKAATQKSKQPTVASGSGGSGATKRAGLPKNGRSASLKKPGGWQSSAVMEFKQRPSPRPHLTGSHPSVPAGELRDETETPRAPGKRVHPSALV